MNRTRTDRRGHLLVLVLVLVVMVGGLLTLLATCSTQMHRDRQADQTRLLARAMTASAAGYARAHLAEWAANPPDKPVELDVSGLLPPNVEGSAVIDFPIQDGRRFCRVTARTQWGPAGAVSETLIAWAK
ncbi:MAG: hypothetical protein HRF43_16585 [Phycisphaerae bacterium]|jgi:type II secretory pathway pseudopilin PulG